MVMLRGEILTLSVEVVLSEIKSKPHNAAMMEEMYK
jgi:hypothetical protein